MSAEPTDEDRRVAEEIHSLLEFGWEMNKAAGVVAGLRNEKRITQLEKIALLGIALFADEHGNSMQEALDWMLTDDDMKSMRKKSEGFKIP